MKRVIHGLVASVACATLMQACEVSTPSKNRKNTQASPPDDGFAPSSVTPSGPGAASGPTGPSKADVVPQRNKRPKVLLVGIDGLRPDALALAEAPHLHRLSDEGAFSDRVETNDTTVSGPGWSSILTGVWRDKHGVKDNTFVGSDYVNHPELLTLIEEANPELHTVRITNWAPLHDIIPTRADEDIAFNYDNGGDVPAVARAQALLSGEDVDAMFFYFAMVDIAGHSHGFSPAVPEYLDAIELVDRQLGDLLQAIQSRVQAEEEDWLIVVTSDHGGTADKQHGRDIPEHRRVNLILHSSRTIAGLIEPAPQQVDVVPTILTYMGLSSSRERDGQSVEVRAKTASLGGNLVSNGDAENDVGRVRFDFNSPVRGWDKRDGGITIRYSGEPGRPIAQRGAGDSFFAGGKTPRAVMSQTISLDSVDVEGRRLNVAADLGGYADQEDWAQVVVQFIRDERVAACDGIDSTYFFRGGHVQKHIHSEPEADDPLPMLIAFPDLAVWSTGVDACVRWDDTHLYLFKDSQVALWKLNLVNSAHPNGRLAPGYPKPIAEVFPALSRFVGGARNLDAVTLMTGPAVYVFKGEEYMRLDKPDLTSNVFYPRLVSSETWPGLFTDRVAGGFRFNQNNKLYFMRGDRYVRYDIATDRTDPGYPLVINDATWPNLATEPSVTLGPVTAADRGNQTKLITRRRDNVAIPSGTKALRVELIFTRATSSGTSDNDGYVDNLSISIAPEN